LAQLDSRMKAPLSGDAGCTRAAANGARGVMAWLTQWRQMSSEARDLEGERMSVWGGKLEPERRTHDVSAATALMRQELSRDEGEATRGAMKSGKARSRGRRTGREAVRRVREATAWEATAGWLRARV
jgi:hypothetical protein